MDMRCFFSVIQNGKPDTVVYTLPKDNCKNFTLLTVKKQFMNHTDSFATSATAVKAAYYYVL